MKRLTMILGCVILVAAIAYPVLAWGPGWGRGHHMMGYERGPGYGWQGGGDYGSLPQEQRTQLDNLHQKFYDDTAALRNEIRAKSGELDTLLNTSNPDPEKLRALQKEVSDLKGKMAEKRLDFELEARKVAPDARLGRGYDQGYGPGMGYGRHHMGGYGPGGCWN